MDVSEWQLDAPKPGDPILRGQLVDDAYRRGQDDLWAKARTLGIDPAKPETMTQQALALLRSQHRSATSEIRTLERDLLVQEKALEAVRLLHESFEEMFVKTSWPSEIKAASKSYQHAPIYKHFLFASQRVGTAEKLTATVATFERATGFLIGSDVGLDAIARCEEFGRELIAADAFRQPLEEMAFEFRFAGMHVALLLAGGHVTPFIFAQKWGSWAPADVSYPLTGADMPARIAMALCVLLDSRSVEVSEPISARRAHSVSPDAPPSIIYRRLTIRDGRRTEGGGDGHHASPRMHWRRGHLRHLASGAVVPVSPCIVGTAERGVVVKDYKLAAVQKLREREG